MWRKEAEGGGGVVKELGGRTDCPALPPPGAQQLSSARARSLRVRVRATRERAQILLSARARSLGVDARPARARMQL